MGRLTRMGCRVSAGVLNIKDTDWEVGRALGLQIVEEKPFSPITLESYDSNLKVAEGRISSFSWKSLWEREHPQFKGFRALAGVREEVLFD